MTRGFIVRTTNGTTWTRSATPARGGEVDLDGIECLSATVCTAVGFAWDAAHEIFNGAILQTTNGTTWRAPNPASDVTGQALDDVTCPTANHCFGVGTWNFTGSIENPLRSLVLQGSGRRRDHHSVDQLGRVIADQVAAWGVEDLRSTRICSGVPQPEAIAAAVDVWCRAAARFGHRRYEFFDSSSGSVHGVTLGDGRAVVVKGHRPAVLRRYLDAVASLQSELAAQGVPGTAATRGGLPRRARSI